MENNKNNLNVPEIEESDFTEFDFEYVHADSHEKIHDEELKTKPTTFAKDALRRFAKNKASVVGAVIIGILLVASFLSYASPYDIQTPAADISRLFPKIRAASDGNWDGTEWRENAILDESTGAPYHIESKNIVPGTLKISEDVTYYDVEPNSYARGGYYRIVASDVLGSGPETYYLTNYSTKRINFNVTQADDLKITINYGGVDNIADYKLAPFSVYLYGKDDSDYDLANTISIPLVQNQISTTGEDVKLEIADIKQKMADASINTMYFAQIRLVFPTYAETNGYILIKDITATCSDTSSEKLKQRLNEISFDDANWVAMNTTPENNPEQYWQSTGKRLIYHAYAHKCSYLFDQYEAVLGVRSDKVIGGSILNKYINNGWCTMSDPNDPSTFVLTHPETDECPLREITGIHYDQELQTYQYEGKVIYYRYLGYNSMPYFILGTDGSGRDMLTLALSCLKNSLLLAVITSAICLGIGLVWGSVSGYFGGNVDLTMERITDILSGVPWIVMMTLVMLLLGRTYLTFGIAVCLTGWIGTSSRTRTQFYRFKGREYVLASRTLGASDGRLIFRHILPNGLGTIVTGSVLMIPSTIFSEATLSYLGLGLQGTASFGVLLSENQAELNSRPMLIIFPSIIISLLMISFNLFGNGLRDALNPTLKGGEQ